ncbi:MAG: GIY-YIG nuclease family protein [Chitinophagaceae bacterium]|nr:GIY-YIG nuclease family protein [Chitinophagaceae bacterium]
MWYVYVLLSKPAEKTYVGYTSDPERRLFEHNVSEMKGFTLRYRPWQIIYTETFATKEEAMKREKFLKTGQGREEVRRIVENYHGRERE